MPVSPGFDLPGVYGQSLAGGSFTVPEKVVFRGGPTDGHRDGYSTHFSRDAESDIARGSLGYEHLRWRVGVIVEYSFLDFDKVALSGGVYEVLILERRARLERIPDDKLPKGLKPIQKDSFTIPLQRPGLSSWANIGAQVKVLEIKAPKQKDGKPTATISVSSPPPHLNYATIREGDTVLLGRWGFVVRCVVPQDDKTKVAGWVEFAPEAIPEAALIAGKKAFVRPVPEKKDDKTQK